MRTRLIVLLLLAVVTYSSTGWADDQFYLVTGIMDFPGAIPNTTVATGINNTGAIVGTYFPSSPGSTQQSFIMTSQGFLPIPNPPGFNANIPHGISDGGNVVGQLAKPGGTPYSYVTSSFLEPDFRIANIPNPYPGKPPPAPDFPITIFNGIASQGGITSLGGEGPVVGTALFADDSSVGFVWTSRNGYTTIAAGTIRTELYGINNAGTIVGTFQSLNTFGTGLEPLHGLIVKSVFGVLVSLNQFDFPPLSSGSILSGINNNGDIVGIVDISPDDPNHGFVQFADGQVGDLGHSFVPKGINDAGQIVGLALDPGGFLATPFDSSLRDSMNSFLANPLSSTSATFFGQLSCPGTNILCSQLLEIKSSFTANGVLPPDTLVLDAAPVPEPSTWLLLGSGLVGLILWRKRTA